MSFTLDVIDTKRSIYSGEAKSLTIPALGGEMTILERHMPLVTPLQMGEVTIEPIGGKGPVVITVGKGMFSMAENAATLLVEDALYSDEISEALSENARERAQELIEKGVTGPEIEEARSVIRRSLVDLKTAKRKKMRV